jgi:hypothetical protein
MFTILTSLFTNFKNYIVVGLLVALGIVGWLYHNSLSEIKDLTAQLADAKSQLEKVVADTNDFKLKTNGIITSYEDDVKTLSTKVESIRNDCDKRVERYRSSKVVPLSSIPNVIDMDASKQYIEEINRGIPDEKTPAATRNTK